MAINRKTPLDYFFLFGMPVVFLAIAWFGIVAILGPAAPIRPVTLIKNGAISIGMFDYQVKEKVGEPKDVERYPEGGFAYVYHQGTAEPFVEEEATVTFSESALVIRINVEKVTIPPAPAKEN